MNVFLVHPNVMKSCADLSHYDPRRARCQLKECCQILAGVEIINCGTTRMRRKNGDIYRMSKSQINHPLIKWCAQSRQHWDLTVEVTQALSLLWLGHASSASFVAWDRRGAPGSPDVHRKVETGYMVIRRGRLPLVVETRREYAALLLTYMQETKGYPVEALSH